MDTTNIGFPSFASEVRRRVDRRLRRIFAARTQQLERLDARLPLLGGAASELSLRGGKRLRAVLVGAGFVSASPHADIEPAIVAGAAFELLQTYFLIHDDWIDGDELRRGGPTAHVALGRSLGSSQLGDRAAILAGDYVVALAQSELASAPSRHELVLAALREFADIQLDTISGQFIDITGAAAESSEYLLEELKTCSYSVRGPLVIGAALGGANPELLEACRAFARPIGIAFQLRDDLLGLFGDVLVTGKPRGNDLRAGKMTFVIREALRRVNGDDRRTLRAVLGQADATEAGLTRALEAIVSSGASAHTEARIAALCAEAREVLSERAGFSARGVDYLAQLAKRLTERVD
jgi:geranylgeranyl diphosphate synthase, type I